VSARFAPVGGLVATGWQSGTSLQQLSSSTYIGRGAELLINRAQSSHGIVAAGEALRDIQVIETRLPITATVIAILLDRVDTNATYRGDFKIAAKGAELVTPPTALGTESRRLLLYDVSRQAADARWISITVGSVEGWRFAGVAGLVGRAKEWGTRFKEAVPENLVPDGPPTREGVLNVRFTIEGI
jgi:hypothetical protein